MPRARAGMKSLGAMSDAIVRVRLADMVWFPLDGREASARTRVFLVENRRFVLYQTYGSDRRDG
jgi:hypothetical protein